MKKSDKLPHKIIPLSHAKNVLPKLKEKKKVLVGGCFDIFHFGHLVFLEKAKELGEVLVIILESDSFISKFKHKIPVHSQFQRARILAAMNIVDLVILLPLLKSDEDYYEVIKMIRPNIIAITKRDPLEKQKKLQASALGAEVKIVTEHLKGFSSSLIYKYAAFLGD